MNDKKICFITCVNNEMYEQEQIRYLRHLKVPGGYEVESLEIRDACSMAAGYNEGMQASDAKYKVYLHQDVFIVNPDFIQNMLRIFAEPEVGVFGMVGSRELPENGIMWYGDRVGKLYTDLICMCMESVLGEVTGKYQEVEALDGFLIVTQYDILWREDLFRDWDFYDISQSQEFLRRGYKVVVPQQEQAWCIHNDDFNNFKNYYKNRRIFVEEYMPRTEAKIMRDCVKI